MRDFFLFFFMEAVQNAIYCAMCLKCSTSQAALRPQGRQWKEPSVTLPATPLFFCLLVPSSPISITAPLINHRSLHPSILRPLSREEKQTAVRVMNSKWISKAERPNNFLQRSAAAAAARTHVDENKCANSIKQIWSAPSFRPNQREASVWINTAA